MLNKILGYVLSGIGLLGIIISSGKFKESIPIIKDLNTVTILIVSAVIVAIGVIMLMTAKGIKQHKEVPIYEGKGKKRKIVGYQREK